MNFSLEVPSVEYKDSYIEGVRAFRREGLWWYDNASPEKLENDFPAFIEELTTRKGETTLWAIVEGKYAGRIALRHELTPQLRIIGGHIGYDTVPAYRGKGLASAMLRKILPLAKTLGLIEVLLTCDDTNTASIKVIEKNGGVLKETKLIAEGKPLKRYYWIPLN